MNDFYDETNEWPTQGDAYREMVSNVGMDRPTQQWILTDYDTWERNPSYDGPEQPHPEDHDPDLFVDPVVSPTEHSVASSLPFVPLRNTEPLHSVMDRFNKFSDTLTLDGYKSSVNHGFFEQEDILRKLIDNR